MKTLLLLITLGAVCIADDLLPAANEPVWVTRDSTNTTQRFTYPDLQMGSHNIFVFNKDNDYIPTGLKAGVGIIFDLSAKEIKVDISGLGIPAAQVNSDWNSVSGVSQILNKPTLGTAAAQAISAFDSSGAAATAQAFAIQRANHTGTQAQSTVTNLVSDLAGKFPNPAGTTAQYLRGDGTTATFPTSNTAFTNGAGYLTAEVDGSVTNEIELPSMSGQSGKFLTNNGTVSSWGVATLVKGFSNPTRSLNTAFQPSTTQDTFVSYTVDVAATLTLTGGATGTVTLQYADNNAMSTNLVDVQSSVNGNTGALTVGLSLTQTSTASVTGVIPAGKWVRISTANTAGSPVFTYRRAQEVTF